jgi:hypothetical protein
LNAEDDLHFVFIGEGEQKEQQFDGDAGLIIEKSQIEYGRAVLYNLEIRGDHYLRNNGQQAKGYIAHDDIVHQLVAIGESLDDKNDGNDQQEDLGGVLDGIGDPEIGGKVEEQDVQYHQGRNGDRPPEQVSVQAPVIFLRLQEFAVKNDIADITDGKDDIVEKAFKKEVERGRNSIHSGLQEQEDADANGISYIVKEFRFLCLHILTEGVEDHHQHDPGEKSGDDVDLRSVPMREDNTFFYKGIAGKGRFDGIRSGSDIRKSGKKGPVLMRPQGDLSVSQAVRVVGHYRR